MNVWRDFEVMNNEITWKCEYISNGVLCAVCGEEENGMPKNICDAHTHGMILYGHLEFQVVIDYGPKEVSRLLNTMGMKVRDGERFKHGDRVKGLYLDCEVELREIPDVIGEPVLRLVIPDKHNRWPEQKADYPYSMQVMSTEMLYLLGKHK